MQLVIVSLLPLLILPTPLGGGVSISGTTVSHADTSSLSGNYGPTANVTGSNGATIVVPQITVDGYGHVTAVTNRTYTSVNTDTNTTYSLVGAKDSTGLIKNGSSVTSTSGLTACPIISGIPYYKDTDTNTTYSAGTGISLSGTTFSNSGVRSITTGSTNGTISVNTNGTSAEVAVKGLGSAAYTNSSAYATAGHTHNYAGSSSAGGSATSAVKLDTSSAGGSTTPVYFSGGKPVACTAYSSASVNYANYAGYVSRDRGVNTVTTLASLPVTKSLVTATLSAATSISLAADMNVGESITVICTPSATFTQPIPTSGSFISMDGDSLSVTSGKVFEINILCYDSAKYSISSKVAK